MTNLLVETIEAIKVSGHVIEDVVFIGSADGEYRTTWPEFEKMADRDYDSGFGGAEVATDLIILFSDGKKMWRGEYDGSEWWGYDLPFEADYTRADAKPITSVIGGYWPNLQMLHDPNEHPMYRGESR